MADYSQEELEKTAKAIGIDPKLLRRDKPIARDDADYSDAELAATAKDIGINLDKLNKGPDIPRAPLRITVRPKGFHHNLASGIADQATQLPVIGPAIDATASATAAGLQPIVGTPDISPDFIGRYNRNIGDIEAARQEFSEQNPKTALGANLAGNFTGGGAMAATRLGRVAMGLSGPSLGIRTVSGAGGQAAIAGTDAIMKDENAIPAMQIGAAGGALGPLTGTAIEHIGTGISNTLWPKKGALKGLQPIVINKLTGALEGETPSTINEAVKRMGPAGVLGDLNQGMTDIAGGIADIPGIGKAKVRSTYQTRADEQSNRLKSVLDRTMGPERNVPEEIENITKTAKATYDPLYEKFHTMAIIPTPELTALIPRLKEANAFSMANKLAGIEGKNKINVEKFKMDGIATSENWDNIKRGLDRSIDRAYKQEGGGNLARTLVGLKNEMLDEIKKTPAGKVWEEARNKFAEKSSIIDEIAAGRDTFLGGRSGISKDELAIELKHLSTPEKLGRLVGMRSAVAEAMGEIVTGDTRLRNKLLAPNNQDKIRLMLDSNPALADELIATLKQEHYLGLKTHDVIGNPNTGASASARTARRDSLMPETTKSDWDLTKPMTYIPPSIRDQFTIAGMSNAWKNERFNKARNQLSDIITMPNSPTMEDLIKALNNEANRQSKVNNFTSRLGQGVAGTITGPGTTEARKNKLGIPYVNQ